MRGVIALTGATGFIGSAIARKLVKEGWRVRALIRAPLRRTRLEGVSIEWVHGTLENIEHLESLVSDAHAVVHCAGAVRGITDADFYDVNVEAVSRLAQIAALRSPAPRFLSISSLAAREPNLSAYAASKSGLIGLTEVLAAEYGPKNVRVNAILPGAVETAMYDEANGTAEEKSYITNLHALKRVGSPDELAQAALYLASDASSFQSGTAMLVDGGLSITRT